MLKQFLTKLVSRLILSLLTLMAGVQSMAALSASATMTWTQSGSTYTYTITLNNTGTTNIGTFWFSWVPGADYLPTLPTQTGSPSGWNAPLVVHGVPGYSIEWVAGAPLPAGQSSSGFQFSSTDTPTTILQSVAATSVVYSGGPFSDAGSTFTVSEGQKPNGVKFAVEHVSGGNPVAGTVTLGKASATDTVVSLISDHPSTAFVAAGSVTVPKGSTSASFTVITKGVSAATPVKITGHFGATNADANLTIEPATLTTFSLSSSVYGGLTPTAAAIFDGLTGSIRNLTVSSGMPAAVEGVSPQTIAAGRRSTPIILKTHGVDSTTAVTVTLGDGSVSLPRQIKVLPALIKSLTGPSAIVGGTSPGLIIKLTGLAGPSGKKVHIVSDHATLISVADATIPSQGSGIALFPKTAGVSAPTNVMLSIGSTIHLTTQLMPASLKTVVAKSSAITGGTSVVLSAFLDGKNGDIPSTLQIATSDTSISSVPATVPLAIQASSSSFVLRTQPVAADKVVTVSVNLNGIVKSVQVTVKAPSPVRP